MASNETTPQPPEGFTVRDRRESTSKDLESTRTSHNIPDRDQSPTVNGTSPGSKPEPQVYDATFFLPYTTPSLPPITVVSSNTPSSLSYVQRCAEVSANANLKDPLVISFEVEKPTNDFTPTSPPAPKILLPRFTATNILRLQAKLAKGSLLVESASFAATACWTPPSALHTDPPSPPSFFTGLKSEGRYIFAGFLRGIQTAMEEHLFPVSEKYWHLSLMARDPRREYVPGAVRAVVEPFLRVAEKEGLPVWLEAGSQRARDIYAHFGFVQVATVTASGVDTYCMIKL